jgi:hypothetical protein
MDPFEPVVPARRNIPMLVVILVVAVMALGLIFIWPAW